MKSKYLILKEYADTLEKFKSLMLEKFNVHIDDKRDSYKTTSRIFLLDRLKQSLTFYQADLKIKHLVDISNYCTMLFYLEEK